MSNETVTVPRKLLVKVIEMAGSVPAKMADVGTCYMPRRLVHQLRLELEELGIDWRSVERTRLNRGPRA